MPNTIPIISVVLPTHNGWRYLDQAVQSVVDQTFVDWELIIVNDASTDDTADKARDWALRDPRIRLIDLVTNRRLPGALNEGFRHAQGRFFTWTSDDNWYEPQAFQRMLQALDDDPSIKLVYCSRRLVNDEGDLIGLEYADSSDELPWKNVVGACFLYHRQVHDDLSGYAEDLFLVEDYEFWLRASLECRFRPLTEVCYNYRMHSNSLTAQRRGEIATALEKAMLRWMNQATLLPRPAAAKATAQLARVAFQLDRPAEGRVRFRRAANLSMGWLFTPSGVMLIVDYVFGPKLGWWLRSRIAGAWHRLTSRGLHRASNTSKLPSPLEKSLGTKSPPTSGSSEPTQV